MTQELLFCQKCGSIGELCLPTKKIIKNSNKVSGVMCVCNECSYTWIVNIEQFSGENYE